MTSVFQKYLSEICEMLNRTDQNIILCVSTCRVAKCLHLWLNVALVSPRGALPKGAVKKQTCRRNCSDEMDVLLVITCEN